MSINRVNALRSLPELATCQLHPMKKVSFALLAIFVALGAVLLVRVAAFKSRQIHPPPVKQINFDTERLIQRLSAAIRIQTVSFQLPDAPSVEEFRRFQVFLAKAFPQIHERLTKETVNQHSLLYTWKGKDEKRKAILLVAHIDVVPVDGVTERSWTHAPFAGQIDDGFVWGRGTMDDKASTMAILEAVEHLLNEGVQPRRTIYLAFGHDEETGGGNGAAKIAALLRARGVELEFVLDEGLNILRGVVGGVTAPVALIGIAEKGYLSVRLTAEAPGGHSSIPPEQTVIGAISRALLRLDGAPFSANLHGATGLMFDYLGPEMSWPQKLFFANLWLFEPIVKRRLSASPLTNAILRTTVVPTIFHAGVRENILPGEASAVINLRILPGETTAGALVQIQSAIDDPQIKIEPLPIRTEPSTVSNIDSASFRALQRAIAETAPEAIVAPSLLVAATDSRHYAPWRRMYFASCR